MREKRTLFFLMALAVLFSHCSRTSRFSTGLKSGLSKGTGSTGFYSFPRFDGSGNYYIVDQKNGAIRKLDTSSGLITTVAGISPTGAFGVVLYLPSQSTLDSSGHLFLADTQNNVIRRLDLSTGNVTIVAGTGIQGYSGDGAAATSARLNHPSSVAVDNSGNLFITDTNNSVIREVDASTGNISTIAGTGSAGYSGDGAAATSATLRYPWTIVIDSSGNLLFADCGDNVIRKVDMSTGNISTIAGIGTAGYSGDGAAATSAELNYPTGIVLDASGNLYIADEGNYVIRKVDTSTGNISTFAGTGSLGYSGDGGPATSAKLNGPAAVSLDSSGNLYIADSNNNVIREVNASTGNISTVVGQGSAGYEGDGGSATAAMLNTPSGVVADSSGNLYIVDSTNNVVRKVTASTGVISTVLGRPMGYAGDGGSATSAELDHPSDLAVDSAGNLVIADSKSNAIRKVNVSTGKISTIAGTGGAGYSGDGGAATDAQLDRPTGVAFDSAGNLYVTDSFNNVIRKIDAVTGTISTVAGNGTAGYTGDGGAATSATLNSPESVIVDSAGNLYIADCLNSVIREVDAATGSISTVAGNGTAGYTGDGGAATSAELHRPYYVAMDGSGNLYIADWLNNVIRKVTLSTGIISTAVGTGTGGYSGDGGVATSAKLLLPTSIVFNSSGDLFIADSNNDVIRKVSTSTGNISTVAGNNTAGYSGDGGSATAAEIDNPM